MEREVAANQTTKTALSLVLVIAALATLPARTHAQTGYPDRTIKIVVPAPPGANLDTIPRIIADKLATRWGHPVIIEHRPGAAQNLGAEAVARSEPDGYTLLATPQGPLVISQHFFAKLGFDPAAFVPVSIIASQPLVLVAHPKFRAANLKELVTSAKASKISFASAGIGSSPHLTGEMLKLAAKIDFVHVPYKGLAPAMTDLLGGHVDMMFDNLTNALPQIRDGKVKALAVASEARIAELPDVPAIAELFPGFYSTSWFAIVAPPKTPPDIAAKISQAIAATLKLPDVVERYRALASTPVGSSPAETEVFLKKESERWRQVIAAAGIKPE
jgi:tripartite-type tricarboxylate transporter receptor subunit TctC